MLSRRGLLRKGQGRGTGHSRRRLSLQRLGDVARCDRRLILLLQHSWNENDRQRRDDSDTDQALGQATIQDQVSRDCGK